MNSSRHIKIAFISSWLPRRCGIATFTSDLIEHSRKAAKGRMQPYVIAMEASEPLHYSDEVRCVVRKDRKKDYIAAADYINFSGVHLVSLQHEFGLFGGDAGAYITLLLKRLNVPVITTLHTILEHPDKHQRRVIADVAAASSRVIVMSRRAIAMLRDIYGIGGDKVEFLPHGLPALAFSNSTPFKRDLGFHDRKIILTFGLLSRNKGIEWAIRALPDVIGAHPDILYLVLGATHPEVKKADGEEYRLSLRRLVKDLGLEEHVAFINRFVTDEELHRYLNAADYYLTPYLSREQITSGTLAFALGLGKAVVSTPYWYAEELLADGRGVLVPFRDNKAIAVELLRLLDDPGACEAMRRRAFDFGRAMTWPRVGEGYWRLFSSHVPDPVALIRARSAPTTKAAPDTHISVADLPELRLDHFLRLTDDTGMLQHAVYAVPDRRHGYCTDDNARALEAMVRLYRQRKDAVALRLIEVYLAFLLHARREDGTFNNFMSFDRRFLAPVQSEDATARTIEALGTLIAWPPRPSLAQLARTLFKDAVAAGSFSLRGRAYEILGLADYLRRFTDDPDMRHEMEAAAGEIMQAFQATATPGWRWFEDCLTYDNAVLPHALFAASVALKNDMYRETAADACQFLVSTTYVDDHFSFVGCQGWYPRGGKKAQFDQQAIDAASMVRMLRAAFDATDDSRYLELKRKAFNWFLGENDGHAALFDFVSKGCFDGLMPDGVNANQGAESLISYTLAHLSIEELLVDDTRN
ncbi:MAG: glycosyltransferase family 4 protein [Zetaproteobacteria bacterium]|nr:MAG: glycosyltransferase family 4 protein [Zetaproteobacteria bacterium]